MGKCAHGRVLDVAKQVLDANLLRLKSPDLAGEMNKRRFRRGAVLIREGARCGSARHGESLWRCTLSWGYLHVVRTIRSGRTLVVFRLHVDGHKDRMPGEQLEHLIDCKVVGAQLW